ncbi:hypothetical protein NSQ59_09380 [Margalitia sp. FSL K6-0131]|uniref:hypothetical protein n=1 Tax=Margalitia sp. FSL K6-0131 TaxID=2954604 RepID=UPI0030FA53D2
MNLLISQVVSIVIFSIVFLAIPMKIKVRKKLILILLSISCFGIEEITWYLFVWWLSVLVVLLFILCITILIGVKINWIETDQMNQDITADNQNILPTPMFSYHHLLERSAAAENLDFSNNVYLKPAEIVTEDESKSLLREIAVATEIPYEDNALKIHNVSNTDVNSDLKVTYKESQANTNDDDLKLIFRNRQNLLMENEKLDNFDIIVNQHSDTIDQSNVLENILQDNSKNPVNDDLQLLYDRIREDKERS